MCDITLLSLCFNLHAPYVVFVFGYYVHAFSCRTMAEGGGKKFGRNYLTWTDEMDTTLLEVLVEHHNNGDHAQNGWKSHVYSAVIGNVREKCSVTIIKENISSRCKTFEKHYEAISKMLSQSGFGWDWINNKLSIDSEDVWIKYVAVRNLSVPHFDCIAPM